MFVAVDETLRYDHSNESYDKLSPFFKNIKSFNRKHVNVAPQ